MTLTELCGTLPPNAEIQSAFIKAWPKIHGGTRLTGTAFTLYPTIMASVSGGSDSDIMLDLIERIGYPLSTVHYVFFDTGMEFEATKRHITCLEEKYGITIERYPAVVPVPLGVKRYGIPFISKQVSEYAQRLQKHNFKWEDRPFDELYAEYPRCKAALRWWCNAWGPNSKMNIDQNPGLKEFMTQTPPDFPISNLCCEGAKKKTACLIEKEIHPDLSCQGLRKAEGGSRALRFTSCFTENFGSTDKFRPIFWFKQDTKQVYEDFFGISHSDCYTKYGLKRTGCACCPFGRNFETELAAAEQFEPKLYKAAWNVFGKSYDYTRRYREFVKSKKGLT